MKIVVFIVAVLFALLLPCAFATCGDGVVEAGEGCDDNNTIAFDAVPAQGGILCTNGRWRSKDGSASGTTPFRVFIKDGVVRRSP